MYNNNRSEYDRLARQSTKDNAKDDFMDFIKSNIDDSIDDGFSLSFDEEHIPPYMLSQISGRKITDPVKSSTGVWYEREELKQLVASSKNPINRETRWFRSNLKTKQWKKKKKNIIFYQ